MLPYYHFTNILLHSIFLVRYSTFRIIANQSTLNHTGFIASWIYTVTFNVSVSFVSPVRIFFFSHRARRGLADLLRKDGIDCVLDQYFPHTPEGWPGWMENNIKSAEFVLLICTYTYINRITGKEDPGKGLGVKWKGKLIYNWIYEIGSIVVKFIPVLFSYADKKYIPEPLKGQTYYTVTDTKAYIDLYRGLSHQPEIAMPELSNCKNTCINFTNNYLFSSLRIRMHLFVR